MSSTTKTTTKNANKSNIDLTKLVFSFRGNNSIGSVLIASYGLRQLTNKSHDATQLILGGKSSINLRKKVCFINATECDFALFTDVKTVECKPNDNSVDAIRPHRVYFKFDQLATVCEILAKNKFNLNGFIIE